MAFGLRILKVKNDIVKDIPVANGRIIISLIKVIPIECNRFFNKELVNWTNKEEPQALGCKSLIFPDLPIPCTNP